MKNEENDKFFSKPFTSIKNTITQVNGQKESTKILPTSMQIEGQENTIENVVMNYAFEDLDFEEDLDDSGSTGKSKPL